MFVFDLTNRFVFAFILVKRKVSLDKTSKSLFRLLLFSGGHSFQDPNQLNFGLLPNGSKFPSKCPYSSHPFVRLIAPWLKKKFRHTKKGDAFRVISRASHPKKTDHLALANKTSFFGSSLYEHHHVKLLVKPWTKPSTYLPMFALNRSFLYVQAIIGH